MVKVILQLYPMLPTKSEEERAALRPIGRNSEVYHQAIKDWTEIIRAADEMDVWAVSTIEHHFHSEGYEVGPNPGILDAYWAAMTKNVRVGALGYVMSAQNPIRVAEEAAILDHLTEGRYFFGVARGYQSRWTNILGQHLGTRATLSPSGYTDAVKAQLSEAEQKKHIEDDRINREIFEKQMDLVLAAWTNDSIETNIGPWQIPYPYEQGTEWAMSSTAKLGAPGEMVEEGTVRRISVVPAPYTKPHPPVFVNSNASLETVEYCGSRGFIPSYFSPVSRAGKFGQAYTERAREAGFNFAPGENQALVRWMQVGDTMEEARQAVVDYDLDIWRNFYSATTPLKLDPADEVGTIVNSGIYAVGTKDDIRQQFVETWQALPAEYVVLIYHFAQQPKESVLHNLEVFMSHVKPELDKLTQYSKEPAGVA
ncbi:MAG: LLM class flavin-dependent oxidoreductase [Dehalococcoidia bacterium]|nr:LLM class flavin-dependent oxidoreductase [Dehalococcoidia bacterium]